MIERRQQEPDYGSIDAAQHRLEAGLRAQEIPQRQTTDNQQERGQENRAQGERRPRQAIGPWAHHCSQVCREGEQRTGDSLRRAIPRDELLVGDPAGWDDLHLDQWQHHVATAKDQRADSKETIEHRQGLTGGQVAQER